MQQKQMDRNIVEMLDALEKNRNESLIFGIWESVLSIQPEEQFTYLSRKSASSLLSKFFCLE